MGIFSNTLDFVSTIIRLGDGSYLSVQTDKPVYYAGETVTGKVVAHMCSPVLATSVVLQVSGKEVVMWDEERVETIWEGEGENRTSRTVYHHHHHRNKHRIFQDLVIVSSLNHVLPPGEWQYPFAYTLRADLPGCLKYARSDRAADPAWHHHGRQLETRAGIVYTFKAKVQNGSMFSRDIRGKQEVIVNSFFDWKKLHPAHAENSGMVRFCCCIPRGRVSLTCDFDKAAYAGGETAQIKAVIANESKNDVRHMKVKLVRNIQMNDGSGHVKGMIDVVAQTSYPGVPSNTTQARDLPLPFHGRPGDYIPSSSGRHVRVSYDFVVECSIPWCSDIRCAMPVTLYQPAPLVWGLQAALAPPPVMMVMQAPPMLQQQQQQQWMQPQPQLMNSNAAMPLMQGGAPIGGYGSAQPQGQQLQVQVHSPMAMMQPQQQMMMQPQQQQQFGGYTPGNGMVPNGMVMQGQQGQPGQGLFATGAPPTMNPLPGAMQGGYNGHLQGTQAQVVA